MVKLLVHQFPACTSKFLFYLRYIFHGLLDCLSDLSDFSRSWAYFFSPFIRLIFCLVPRRRSNDWLLISF